MGKIKGVIQRDNGLDTGALLVALQSFMSGDYSNRLPINLPGVDGEIAKTVNELISTQASATENFVKIFQEVGQFGLLDSRLDTSRLSGRHIGAAWSLHAMLDHLVSYMNEIMQVVTAFANGDLSQRVPFNNDGKPKEGYFLLWAETVNHMFDVLSTLAFEISRVAREVGVEGKLNLQFISSDSEGVWKEMVESINLMSANLTDQLRAIHEVASLATGGDFTHSVTVVVGGEVGELTEHINQMIRDLHEITLKNTEANIRSLELLADSQALAEELLSQQEELQVTNQELEEKAQLLEEQNLEVELRSRELEIAKAQIEEKAIQLTLSSKYKSDFLSNMSHEIRTPLNSLLILAEHLAGNSKNHLDPKEVEFAKLIQVSGNDLLSLINNILDLAKIESGVVSVNLSAVPILEIQNQIEKTFRYMAENQELDFSVSFANGLKPVIVTDAMRLQQVIKNLISNAFKFTKKGKVSIRVEHAHSGWNPKNESLNQAQRVFAFTVTDTGIGISPHNQEIIFEAFHQADGGTDRKFGGTGLGLSISREIANLLGGELKLVQSTLNIGSIFTLFLPCGKIEDLVIGTKDVILQGREVPLVIQMPELDSSAQLDQVGDVEILESVSPHEEDFIRENDRKVLTEAFAGKKVLIVDDDNRNIVALTAVLESRGAIVYSEESGRRAIELLSQVPDMNLVLMDIMMPGMDGYETIREIRTFELFSELPIIALTAKAMVGDRERCLEAGASEYLSKPVDLEKLSAIVQSWF